MCYGAWSAPLVAAEVTAYRDSWLFAFAMVHNVEVGGVALSDRASEAAFALSSLISQPEQWQEQPFAAPTHSNHAKEEGTKVEDGIDAMDWDEPEEPLPAELDFLWQGVVHGREKIGFEEDLGCCTKI